MKSINDIKEDDVEWIVNDNGELGVKIGEKLFFLYKGYSLEYEDGKHDDGTPMYYRDVYKREFGECCHPENFWLPSGHRKFDNFKDSAPEKDWKIFPNYKPESVEKDGN